MKTTEGVRVIADDTTRKTGQKVHMANMTYCEVDLPPKDNDGPSGYCIRIYDDGRVVIVKPQLDGKGDVRKMTMDDIWDEFKGALGTVEFKVICNDLKILERLEREIPNEYRLSYDVGMEQEGDKYILTWYEGDMRGDIECIEDYVTCFIDKRMKELCDNNGIIGLNHTITITRLDGNEI